MQGAPFILFNTLWYDNIIILRACLLCKVEFRWFRLVEEKKRRIYWYIIKYSRTLKFLDCFVN